MKGYFLIFLVSVASAAGIADLEGTWSTKSREVLTGPGFYDPEKEELLEPKLTGFSYSFTKSGHFEEAYYRAVSNPTDPSCPKGIMQWQHGNFTVNSNGSLTLTPYAVDGRQLLSDPCKNDVGRYTMYNQTELFQSFSVSTDKFHGVKRLDLYAFDGAPMNPMYLVQKPPEMLPTTTLNLAPTETARRKRHYVEHTKSPLNTKSLIKRDHILNPDYWWWLGLIMTSIGGIALFYF
ncbi:hypothetical protein PHISCL_00768 [Aspergillus sclerotialis]|uniref:Protein ROT1 n=1 Tax=Aspergillus sclerotialis TaxID=2070753 RepID=A0A3A2ZUW7_9EURO|nr:hypothetical protein PHISCL_00768 [Aspergillus sclerotialis]